MKSHDAGYCRQVWGLEFAQRLHGSSFLRLIFRILEGNPEKELQWSTWVGFSGFAFSGALRVQVLSVTDIRLSKSVQSGAQNTE